MRAAAAALLAAAAVGGQQPTAAPSRAPGPSAAPSLPPTSAPSPAPSGAPSPAPTLRPSAPPSPAPSAAPSGGPSAAPSRAPSTRPSTAPSANPSTAPSAPPSRAPSAAPSAVPSAAPSTSPTRAPSSAPSASPTWPPSRSPSAAPSIPPSPAPSAPPTSAAPSAAPSPGPSVPPSMPPTAEPSAPPTPAPSLSPSAAPSLSPSVQAPPTVPPSRGPSVQPPSAGPSVPPTLGPSFTPPTRLPTTLAPTRAPAPELQCRRLALCELGRCTVVADPDGTACADGDPDTAGDRCAGGTCSGTVRCGVAVCSAPGMQCATPACRGGACATLHRADGSACSDGDPGTVRDQCVAGACQGVDRCRGVRCPPAGQCESGVACDPWSGLCRSVPRPDGAPCDDGDALTEGDYCSAGRCVGPRRCAHLLCAPPPSACTVSACAPAGGCQELGAAEGTPCDDSDTTTDHDRCLNGTCVGTVSCGGFHCAAAAPECARPVCRGGRCAEEPRPDGTPCSDGHYGTVRDACAAGRCLGVSLCGSVSCPDAGRCHAAPQCSPATGLCSAPVLPDGSGCGAGDRCVAGACVAGLACGGTLCYPTAATCHEAACLSGGRCGEAPLPDGAACTDGAEGTFDDRCVAGTCVGTDRCAGVSCGTPPDALQCRRAGRCGAATGRCEWMRSTDGASCTDSDPTTQGDQCIAGACVGFVLCAGAVCSAQHPQCSAPSCDSAGGCGELPRPDGLACDDGSPVTVGDRCVAGTCRGTGGAQACAAQPCGGGQACSPLAGPALFLCSCGPFAVGAPAAGRPASCVAVPSAGPSVAPSAAPSSPSGDDSDVVDKWWVWAVAGGVLALGLLAGVVCWRRRCRTRFSAVPQARFSSVPRDAGPGEAGPSDRQRRSSSAAPMLSESAPAPALPSGRGTRLPSPDMWHQQGAAPGAPPEAHPSSPPAADADSTLPPPRSLPPPPQPADTAQAKQPLLPEGVSPPGLQGAPRPLWSNDEAGSYNGSAACGGSQQRPPAAQTAPWLADRADSESLHRSASPLRRHPDHALPASPCSPGPRQCPSPPPLPLRQHGAPTPPAAARLPRHAAEGPDPGANSTPAVPPDLAYRPPPPLRAVLPPHLPSSRLHPVKA